MLRRKVEYKYCRFKPQFIGKGKNVEWFKIIFGPPPTNYSSRTIVLRLENNNSYYYLFTLPFDIVFIPHIDDVLSQLLQRGPGAHVPSPLKLWWSFTNMHCLGPTLKVRSLWDSSQNLNKQTNLKKKIKIFYRFESNPLNIFCRSQSCTCIKT